MAGAGVTDPSNLIRVMPAKGDAMEGDGAVRAVVFAGSAPRAPSVWRELADAHLVIAADGGLDAATPFTELTGRAVDVVVGDLDSVTPAALDAVTARGVVVERHPAAKDATDLELALLAARDRGATRVTVLAGDAGRHDHVLANALVLAAPAFAGMDVDAVVGTARVTVVLRARELRGPPGSLCSLLPVGGVARGVRTCGLRYPLDGEDLAPGSTRGVSNELTDPVATVSLVAGTVLAVQPHALEV